MSVRVSTLENGIRVVTDDMPWVKTASVGIWVRAGARDEMPKEHGLAHFLEHMAFKGTRTRSALAIAEEIEAVGGDLNAATSVDNTGYFAHVLGGDVDVALAILGDIVVNSTFDKEELEREKNVVIQEIGAEEDTPDDLVHDLFTETAFAGQVVGRPILGTPKTVAKFDQAAIRAYLDRHYRGDRMVVAAAGQVEHDRVVEAARRTLHAVPPTGAPEPAAARYTGGVLLEARKLEQTHVLIGLEGVAYEDPESYALGVFTNLLGGGMSSRLFQEVREKRGLCYSIYAFQWAYADSGLFGIYAGTEPRDVGALLEVSLETLDAAVQAIRPAEIARAKAQMKVSVLAALERTGSRAEQLARQLMFFGRIVPTEEIVEKIDAVTEADVRRVAARIRSGRPTLTVLGPKRSMAEAERIAERLVPRLG